MRVLGHALTCGLQAILWFRCAVRVVVYGPHTQLDGTSISMDCRTYMPLLADWLCWWGCLGWPVCLWCGPVACVVPHLPVHRRVLWVVRSNLLSWGRVGRVCRGVIAGVGSVACSGGRRAGSAVFVWGMWKREGARWWCPLPVRFGCGGVLLSHTLPGAVPSPCQVLASGFGMGPGVSPGPWPPQILCYTSHGIVSPRVPLGDRGGLGTG